MFAHTGPHELLVPLKGSWKDGSQALGMAGIKMHFRQPWAPHSPTFKGPERSDLGHLAELIGIELNQKFSTGHLSSTTQEMARTDSATGTLLEAGLRNTAKRRWPTSVPWLTAFGSRGHQATTTASR